MISRIIQVHHVSYAWKYIYYTKKMGPKLNEYEPVEVYAKIENKCVTSILFDHYKVHTQAVTNAFLY